MRSSEMDQNFEIKPFSVARILSLLVVVSSRISFFGGVESKVDGPMVRKWTVHFGSNDRPFWLIETVHFGPHSFGGSIDAEIR